MSGMKIRKGDAARPEAELTEFPLSGNVAGWNVECGS
jgi:hypothetical protein